LQRPKDILSLFKAREEVSRALASEFVSSDTCQVKKRARKRHGR
jgi:hypothetical protein